MPNDANDLPVGAILPTLIAYNASNVTTLAESGYYFCDLSHLPNNSDNAELAAALWISWGGTLLESGDVGSFYLPPLSKSQKPIFLRGVDRTAQRDPDAYHRVAIRPGGATGPDTGSFQDQATAAPTQGNEFTTETAGKHTHTCTGIGDFHRHYRGSGDPKELEDAGSVKLRSSGEHIHQLGEGQGSGGDATTAPMAISVNWIIKHAS